MSTVLVVGASRGIGFEFVKQYAEAGWEVLATVRDKLSADQVRGLGEKISVYPLDVRMTDDIRHLATQLSKQAVDVLIVNAGVGGSDITPDAEGAREWLDVIGINTVGATMCAMCFIEHVARSKQKKLVCMSSTSGSINCTDEGESMPYKTSKAALNMAWKTLSETYKDKRIICTAMHPGTVQTRMTDKDAPLDVRSSVRQMIDLISRLEAKDNGRFLQYDGKELPW